ncbi:bifunctional hydroxymethylpyrimidine kinase/phosphomethylpyrimidine kinase [Weissella kandleri]|uniref:bifunctional hydroxymethylpyrimidine kinase/phosphomethylpyrimidine kinase n=1 Tax=Weissella kandleri TaxID=1616 RepID=UPI00387E2D68
MIQVPQVTTIAGIDSSGGAGVNADLKTFHQEHVYAASIITGVTAQNTLGVQGIQPVDTQMIAQQFQAVFEDLEIQAAKTGALFDAERVESIVAGLKRYPVQHLVVDPVMVAKGGATLLEPLAIQKVKTNLFPLAELITPNLAEAETLLGRKLTQSEAIEAAALELQAMGPKNVLIKGGHLAGTEVSDVLLTVDGNFHWYTSPRIDTVRTHGTGDTLAAYITAKLAQGQVLTTIMPQAKAFMQAAIGESIAVGHGHGPLNHWVAG